jgi:hypothetical protein
LFLPLLLLLFVVVVVIVGGGVFVVIVEFNFDGLLVKLLLCCY